jgi:hypothetical protein
MVGVPFIPLIRVLKSIVFVASKIKMITIGAVAISKVSLELFTGCKAAKMVATHAKIKITPPIHPPLS